MGHGDCDAFYYDDNNIQQHLCYSGTGFAQIYTDRHGPIIDLAYQDRQGVYHSVAGSQ